MDQNKTVNPNTSKSPNPIDDRSILQVVKNAIANATNVGPQSPDVKNTPTASCKVVGTAGATLDSFVETRTLCRVVGNEEPLSPIGLVGLVVVTLLLVDGIRMLFLVLKPSTGAAGSKSTPRRRKIPQVNVMEE